MKKEQQKRKQTDAIELICGLRLAKQLSQREVYVNSGVDVSKYEVGNCIPKSDAIARLCSLYQISVAGFWAICEAYTKRRISKSKAIEILDQWQKHDKVFQLAVEMIIFDQQVLGRILYSLF